MLSNRITILSPIQACGALQHSPPDEAVSEVGTALLPRPLQVRVKLLHYRINTLLHSLPDVAPWSVVGTTLLHHHITALSHCMIILRLRPSYGSIND